MRKKMRNCEKKSGYSSRCYNECICGPPVNWLDKKITFKLRETQRKKSMLNIQNTFVRLQTHSDVNIQLTMKNPFRFYANCDENHKIGKAKEQTKKKTLNAHTHNQYSVQPGTIHSEKPIFLRHPNLANTFSTSWNTH